ncbi:putative mannonate dehydratase [Campylobacter geochelonis]|uniref:Putative mannonate dehydratase n=1 Tax=Campylobacter geochelonis TaxID=1780362 RepID=A0A128EHS9_9BACT|nr:putative mannonate dehydratase [Campylobacter geochelonis]
MQTVDFHSHFLIKVAKFNQIFDKIALNLFARQFSIDKKSL